MTHQEALLHALSVTGLSIADVGCGDGFLCDALSTAGARVTGVECSKAMLRKIAERSPAPSWTLIEGQGEALPLPPASLDIVVYLNAFHHITPSLQSAGLREAHRVLKKEGRLYVAEPETHGEYFEITRLVDDETETRDHARDLLPEAPGFRLERRFHYRNEKLYSSFEEFRDRSIAIHASRGETFARIEHQVRELFHRNAQRTPDGRFLFLQPMRVDLLRRE